MRGVPEIFLARSCPELRNVIEHNLILNSGPVLHAELPNALQDKKNVFATAG